MSDLFLLFNHSLTAAQEADARRSLGISRIVTPPSDIQALWMDVPPDIGDLLEYLAPVSAWLSVQARPGDYVLIQGEFGATWLMIQEAFRLGITPVYSTTRREAVEKHLPGGKVALHHTFSHVRYRRYGV